MKVYKEPYKVDVPAPFLLSLGMVAGALSFAAGQALYHLMKWMLT